jgi:hypothetical protein
MSDCTTAIPFLMKDKAYFDLEGAQRLDSRQ